jgi:NADH-quinone oxidoreductase subunit A
MNQEYFSVLIQVLAALGFAGMILGLSVLFGKRAQLRASADIPYECGMIPTGDGAPMFSVKFYIVAILFVIFDIEVLFLYPWALNFKDQVIQSGPAFFSMVGFLVILAVAYLFSLAKGALIWHRNPRTRR